MVKYDLCHEHNKTGHARDRNIFGGIVRAQFFRYTDFVDMRNNALVDKSYAKIEVLEHFLLEKWCTVVWNNSHVFRFEYLFVNPCLFLLSHQSLSFPPNSSNVEESPLL